LELVYLWVEDYKNIKKQGFNFSPKFNCHYDGETLTIKDNIDEDGNKKYIENFFGDNINVTAIVGKNGSGKSALVFQDIYFPKDIKIFFNDKKLHIIYLDSDNNNAEILDIVNHTEYAIVAQEIGDDDYTIYFNWDVVKPSYMDIYTYSFGKDNLNILLPLLGRIDENLLDLDYFNIEIMKKIIQFNQDFSFQTFSYKPYYIRLNISSGKQEKLESYNIGKVILQLKTDAERKMKFDNFFDSYYKNNKQDIHQLMNDKLLFFEITDIKGRDFFDLSHGERSIFLTNLILFDKVEEKNTDLIIYLDEPDLTLHPEWQKKYINELVKTFSTWNKKIHFIITSHSPFIVSDLPRENIIFLKDGKQVNGIEKKQTFGANIHTLLSDSFFMEDGLMGEFAKQKINEIITNLKDEEYTYIEKEKTNVLLTIESIGEPFLKSKLLDMYNRRFIDDYKIREQKRIDEQIKILQEKREQLDD